MALPPADDDGYHSEAMDMSDSDASSSEESSATDAQQDSKKRKMSILDGQPTDVVEQAAKRTKISTARDLSDMLPHAIWQRVFAQQPPAMLFRLARVNKRFKFLIERAKEVKTQTRRGTQNIQQMESEAIWMHSRRTTYPSLPRPLSGLNEASMLRLATAERCQNCHQRHPPVAVTGPLNGGPGMTGVRPIWQFKRALCGTCLKQLSLTDVELYRMNAELGAADLKRALDFVLVTKDYHLVSEQTARLYAAHGIEKLYLRADVDNILNEFKDAQAFGGGAQEEWVKGLDDVGKAAAADASRWQRWEDQLPSDTYLPAHLRKLDTISFGTKPTVQPAVPDISRAAPSVSLSQHSLPPTNTVHPLPKPVHSMPKRNDSAQTIHNGTSDVQKTNPAGHRQPRAAAEAQQGFVARRAEIERRARMLVPAIEPALLEHMDAFKAAIMIGVPLTDADWDRLRPRLEAERERAEQMHYNHVQAMAAFHAANPSNWQYPQDILPQSKNDDREWELSQEPLREMLGFFADEIINGTWRAQPVTRDMVPYFAADVLTGVQQRYELHRKLQQESGHPDTPGTFLSLDAMKWVFENKIKQIAEPQQREMFMCAGCHEEGTSKWLAFEGLIQHYGAKHTTDFSRGNITVHWQTAEWTDYPPFVTEVALLAPKHRKSNVPPKRPQPNHQRQQGNGVMLSSNPLFAPTAASSPLETIAGQQAAVAKITSCAQLVWSALDGVSALHSNTRAIAVLAYIQHDFMSTYKTALPIDLFIKAITINDSGIFDDLKEVKTLTCNFCEPYLDNSDHLERMKRIQEKKMYRLVPLLNHFQIAHVSSGISANDWVHAIDRPDVAEIRALLEAVGMNDHKLSIIDIAFPNVLPNPLPQIGEITEVRREQELARRVVAKQLGIGGPKQNKKKKGNSAREYNPNDAIIPDRPGPVDLSQFDTDPQPGSRPPPSQQAAQLMARPDSALGSAGAAMDQLTIGPEVRAVLESLANATQGHNLPQLLAQLSQTPAVQPPTEKPLSPPPAPAQEVQREQPRSGQSNAPDISAIIASLQQGTKQASSHAPPTPSAPPSLPQPLQSQPSYHPQEQQHYQSQQYQQHDRHTPQQQAYQHNAALHSAPQQQAYQHSMPQYMPPQQYMPQPASQQQYQPPPPAYAGQHQGYGTYQSQPAYQYQGYAQPTYQQQPPPPMQQQWAPPQTTAPQMQPVPGNPGLMYDPRTGQYYELVPEGY